MRDVGVGRGRVDAWEAGTWSDRSIPTDERALRHEAFEAWLVTAGVSMCAFHAVTLALRRADRFPLAIGLRGNSEPSAWHGWGEVPFFHSPLRFVPGLHGDRPSWRAQLAHHLPRFL